MRGYEPELEKKKKKSRFPRQFSGVRDDHDALRHCVLCTPHHSGDAAVVNIRKKHALYTNNPVWMPYIRRIREHDPSTLLFTAPVLTVPVLCVVQEGIGEPSSLHVDIVSLAAAFDTARG